MFNTENKQKITKTLEEMFGDPSVGGVKTSPSLADDVL